MHLILYPLRLWNWYIPEDKKKNYEKLWNNESGSKWYKKYHESWKNKNAEIPRIYELYEILIAILIRKSLRVRSLSLSLRTF